MYWQGDGADDGASTASELRANAGALRTESEEEEGRRELVEMETFAQDESCAERFDRRAPRDVVI